MYRVQINLIGLLLILVMGGAMAGKKAYLGIFVPVDGEGSCLNPALKSEGKKAVGSKAPDMLHCMNREVDQTVRLSVQKSSGDVRRAEVVAGLKLE